MRPFIHENNDSTPLFYQSSFLKRISSYVIYFLCIKYFRYRLLQETIYWFLASLPHSRVFMFHFVNTQCKQTNKCIIVSWRHIRLNYVHHSISVANNFLRKAILAAYLEVHIIFLQFSYCYYFLSTYIVAHSLLYIIKLHHY